MTVNDKLTWLISDNVQEANSSTYNACGRIKKYIIQSV